jgi:predicted acyltransferase
MPARLYSLDAFRGLTMIWMFSAAFGLTVFNADPGWKGAVAAQFEHSEWIGYTTWDMIQPFFMFIVGVAMPIAFARRSEAGESWVRQFGHAVKRCLLLIACGLLARSIQAGKPTLDLINVLAQVSGTYFIAFLLLRRGWRLQAGVAAALLVATYCLYRFTGFADPWAHNDNFGWYVDGLILGKHWGGGYATLNFLPSAFNTIFGVIAGTLLMSGRTAGWKARVLGFTGAGLLATGLALHPWIPICKKIWTPSFALLSTGWGLLALLAFYWVCDIRGWQKWAKVLVIVGSNSIFIYLFHEILGSWMRKTVPVFTGWLIDWSPLWGQVASAWLLVAFQIWVCAWLYRRKIFFKL